MGGKYASLRFGCSGPGGGGGGGHSMFVVSR